MLVYAVAVVVYGGARSVGACVGVVVWCGVPVACGRWRALGVLMCAGVVCSWWLVVGCALVGVGWALSVSDIYGRIEKHTARVIVCRVSCVLYAVVVVVGGRWRSCYSSAGVGLCCL